MFRFLVVKMLFIRKVFLLQVLFNVLYFVSCYDRGIKISHLDGCRELLIENHEINDIFEISNLVNNEAKVDEILRMKFYVLGHDMHLRLSDSYNLNDLHYLTYFHGSGGGEIYKTAIAQTESRYNSWKVLEEAVETAITDTFYYTLLHLVVTRDGWIKFFLNETEPLVSTRVWNYFPPKFISFSKSTFEENSRIFFDCPEERNHHSEFSKSTVNYDVEFVGELREEFVESKASWLTGQLFLYVFAISLLSRYV